MGSYNLPNGSKVRAAKTLGAVENFTAATNAAEVELTMGAAPSADLKAGAIVLVTSGWKLLNFAVARVKSVSASKVVLESIDTSDTNAWAAGAGAPGTLQVVKAWAEIPNITTVANAGGEQQTTSVQFLDSDQAVNLSTTKSAYTQTYTFAHDAFDPVRKVLEQLDRSGNKTPVWFHQPRANEERYYAAQISFAKIPATAINEVETVNVVFNLQGEVNFYKPAGNP